jgi:hypothetical protein
VPAYVVLQLAPVTGRSRAASGTLLNDTRVKKLLAKYGARRLPAPESVESGDEAGRFTTIAVPDMARASKLAAALRAMDGIDSAFAKPGEELP